MAHLLSIEKLFPAGEVSVPGYFVASTAPINIEDASLYVKRDGDPGNLLHEMATRLKTCEDSAEVLIVIHGYNTGREGSRYWYQDVCRQIQEQYPDHPQGLVVLGYRWPSEVIAGDESGSAKEKRRYADRSLPMLLSLITKIGLVGIVIGAIGSLISLIVSFLGINSIGWLACFNTLLVISLIPAAVLLTLVLLRLTGYFRDSYRATNFGVADLVELIRQLDNTLVETAPGTDRAAKEASWQNRRIRLSFLGHSMGGFVVTNAVRVLSDVFDRRSIGTLDIDNQEKCPSPEIGHVFSLGRLVLVSPDIPAEAVISGRANVLRSSLRRFEEAYLFSNEGDMALRLASTAANYFSYPTRTREGGYRLGNVTVRDCHAAGETASKTRHRKPEKCGIVNQQPDGQLAKTSGIDFLAYLFIRQPRTLADRQREVGLEANQRFIAELFTYFDCTDYKENGKGVVSHALGKPTLSFWDYVSLTLDFFAGKIDTHGGYFWDRKDCQPELSRQLIYGLACLGWKGYLTRLKTEPAYATFLAQQQAASLPPLEAERIALIQTLSQLCEQKGIQVLLAPERFYGHELGKTCDRSGY